VEYFGNRQHAALAAETNPDQAHLNPPRRIKGRPVKAFAAKTVFSAA
jgi:hypothetical protein